MSSDYSYQRLIDFFTPATRFYPPNRDDTPQTLFTSGNTSLANDNIAGNRFLRHSNHRQMLIYTDGSCLRHGKPDAVGGWAFVFKDGRSPRAVNSNIISFPLEDRGPLGELYKHTSNRAELRAVIACLQFCLWNSEGYNELVIATDSEYVVKGATKGVADWVRRGWKTCEGKDVKNTDLWVLLFEEIRRFKENQRNSLRVLFWRIPREWNTVADRGAKEAAATGERLHYFKKTILITGPICQARARVAMDHGARADYLYGAQCKEIFWSCDYCGCPNSHFVPL